MLMIANEYQGGGLGGPLPDHAPSGLCRRVRAHVDTACPQVCADASLLEEMVALREGTLSDKLSLRLDVSQV